MTQLDPSGAAAVAPTSLPPKLLSITADRAISLARWWMRLGVAFNVLMVAAVFATAVVGFQQGLGSLPAIVASAIWFGVLVLSVPARRLVIDAVPLIAAGEFGLAEDRLSQSLQSFSVLRSTRLLGLQQLALLRHSQSNWADVAKLCRELIDRQRPRERSIDSPSRLMLAEALIELGDVVPAQREIHVLSGRKMGLRETLVLTTLRLEAQVRAGAWPLATQHLQTTLGLAELMPPLSSARTHALLALAAKKQGMNDWQAYLSRRALLLAEPEAITRDRPFLSEALTD